jgi:hypothetical protein
VCSVFCQFLPMEKHVTYDVTFKRKVILCTEKIGNHATGRKCTVSEAKYKNKTVFMSDK